MGIFIILLSMFLVGFSFFIEMGINNDRKQELENESNISISRIIIGLIGLILLAILVYYQYQNLQ